MKDRLVLTTLLYEGNAGKILDPKSWFLLYNSSLITNKLIIVNNCDLNKWKSKLDQVKNELGIEHMFADDYAEEVNNVFGIDISESKTIGYRYILPYFSATLHLSNGYVFHVSEDCTNGINITDEFISESLNKIKSDDECIATTVSWGKPKQSFGYDVGEWEQIETFRYLNKERQHDDKFWSSIGFSDQVFIASVDKLKTFDYRLESKDNPICGGTPYCPESWEKRVAEYMYHNNLYKAVWKDNSNYYTHEGK